MLFGESKLAGKIFADQVSIKQRARATAPLQEFRNESVGDGRLSRSRKAGEENRDSLLVTRRIAAAQFLYHLGISEPRGNIAALVEALPEFSARNVQHLCPLRNCVGWHVTVFVLQIDHHLEGNHGDSHFLFMLLEEFLSIVGTVEVLAVCVFSRTSMIAANDKVRAAVIFTNQDVPYRFARSAHPHAER